MDIPRQRPDESTLLVVHDACEGEVATHIAVDGDRVVRTGLCLGCGEVGELTVV